MRQGAFWGIGNAVRLTSLRRALSSGASVQKEMEVVKSLKGITDPITNRALQSLGMLQSIKVDEGDSITVRLDFLIPGYPYHDQVVQEIKGRLTSLGWPKAIKFNFESPKKCASLNTVSFQETTITKVAHIIGVSSCKGGVGKSTVAANLAVTLSRLGLRVGLLDADVYGPSLPTLLPAQSDDVLRSPTNPKQVLPLRAQHCPELKMLSFGHVNPKAGAPGAGGKAAAVVRGPIASKLINQLLLATDWGALDYLLLDMPPGTGDIQITLSQSACMSGAVVVTTPHQLSLVDAAKGVAMFEELKVPTLAVVENMAHFTCEHGTRYFPFGRGGRENLLRGCQALLGSAGANQARTTTSSKESSSKGGCGSGQPHSHAPGESCTSTGTASTTSIATPAAGAGADVAEGVNTSYLRLQHCPMHSLPITPYDPEDADALLPVTVRDPGSEAAATYRALATDVLAEVFKAQLGAVQVPSISLSSSGEQVLLRYYTASRTAEFALPSEELRLRDPMTGKPRPPLPGSTAEEVRAQLRGVRPVRFDHKGQYGVAVVWSDGHFADIFPYDVLRSIAEDCARKR